MTSWKLTSGSPMDRAVGTSNRPALNAESSILDPSHPRNSAAPDASPPSAFRRARRLWETARHLTVRQGLGQIRHRILPPSLLASDASAPAVQAQPVPLQAAAGRDACHAGGGRFCFLNRPVDLGWPVDWTAEGLPRLWRYHLHYFDCLGQPGLAAETGWALMRDWIAGHPARRRAVGWEPYPLSLRVVNWLKFLHEQGEHPADILRSLALQGANLARQIEHHLLGNHLFANGKALWWLGTLLGQPRWRRTGRRIVLAQLDEQFLPDGGHFELSPMYHALMLEDLLDLVNLAGAAGDRPALARLQRCAGRALDWLLELADADGRIPLLNDSAHGMARPLAALREYAARLGVRHFPAAAGVDQDTRLECPSITVCSSVAASEDRRTPPGSEVWPDGPGWMARNLSGYWIFKNSRMRLLFDTAPLGPDYLPGHAHCDLLAVLLDLDGRPIFTDTGVPEYAEGPARDYCRSTAAHNTVRLDGLDQADLWKSFRMGRRGYPGPVRRLGNGIACGHDGFSRQRAGLAHERTLLLESDGFSLVDDLTGPGAHRFEARFHLAPGIAIGRAGPGWEVDDRLRLQIRGADVRLETSPYHPEFGQTVWRPCLVLSGSFDQRTRLELRCTYSS